MQEEEKLTVVLGMLDNYWAKITNDLSVDQMDVLKTELSGLASKVETAKKPEDIHEASQKFFNTLSNLGPLGFLAKLDEPKTKTRGGTLPEPQDDIKIKIINYCVMLQGKIDENPETAFQ